MSSSEDREATYWRARFENVRVQRNLLLGVLSNLDMRLAALEKVACRTDGDDATLMTLNRTVVEEAHSIPATLDNIALRVGQVEEALTPPSPPQDEDPTEYSADEDTPAPIPAYRVGKWVVPRRVLCGVARTNTPKQAPVRERPPLICEGCGQGFPRPFVKGRSPRHCSLACQFLLERSAARCETCGAHVAPDRTACLGPHWQTRDPNARKR